MDLEAQTQTEPQYVAKLVRGERYALRDKVFDRGVEVIVSEAERDHLDEHAVDVIQSPGWNEEYDDEADRIRHMPKFVFQNYAGGPINVIDADTAERNPPPRRRGTVPEGRRASSPGGAERA